MLAGHCGYQERRVTSRSCSVQHGIQLVSQGIKHGADVIQNVLGGGRCGAASRESLNEVAVGLLPWQSCLMANTLYTAYNLPVEGVSVLPLWVSSEAWGQRTGLRNK